MNRAAREAMARQTVAILADGGYTLSDGAHVRIAPELNHCVEGTRLFQPEEAQSLLENVLAQPSAAAPVSVEIENETTLAGIARLLREGCKPVLARPDWNGRFSKVVFSIAGFFAPAGTGGNLQDGGGGIGSGASSEVKDRVHGQHSLRAFASVLLEGG